MRKAAAPMVVTHSSDVLGHQGWLKTGTKHLTTGMTGDLGKVVKKVSQGILIHLQLHFLGKVLGKMAKVQILCPKDE